MTETQGEALRGTFLDESHYDLVIDHDADGYDLHGNLLFRYRKNAIPMDVLRLGYESFKDSIIQNQSRGLAAGKPFKHVRKDGSVSNTTVSNSVQSGAVGFIDPNGMYNFCRKTAFTRDYFDKFLAGIPFVEFIDSKYKEMCPEHHAKQLKIARGTNINYRIKDTSYTTVTVNRNFRTAVHQDAGDFPEGFGNLCVYREGYYEGAYFVLPEFRVAVDMQNQDLLFVDVHHWHGNTEFKNMSPDYMRVSFVMYYREYLYKCKSPTEELKRVKIDETGYMRL